MSIASTPFLFLFFPIAIAVYFLLPQENGLFWRNSFLIAISLFFYAWGEPVFVLFFLMLIVLTWLLGRMAANQGSLQVRKTAICLTVLMNLGALLVFKQLNFALDSLGLLANDSTLAPLPLGMTFFAFHSISYVVDIYRGRCAVAPKLFYAALYLSVFFKIQQGPIIPYHEFEPQIQCRTTTRDDFCEGIRRLAIGLGKKMIIASNLAFMVRVIFSSDFSQLSLSDAWIGCVAFMIFMYFDFAGYSDMAIGLARIFGFKMPENFNFPYISTSIGEYWRRWHITLCAWFRDYLYFPIVLGPSVRFRKLLLRHHVNDQLAETLQNLFVPAFVWLMTALWHGTNWNYTIWGLVNSTSIVAETYIRPLKNRRLDKIVRWLVVMLILLLSVPLICTRTLGEAALYFKAMFAGTGLYTVSASVSYLLQIYGPLLMAGIAGSLMVLPWLKDKLCPKDNPRWQTLWNWGENVLLLVVVVFALGFLLRAGSVTFLYQQ